MIMQVPQRIAWISASVVLTSLFACSPILVAQQRNGASREDRSVSEHRPLRTGRGTSSFTIVERAGNQPTANTAEKKPRSLTEGLIAHFPLDEKAGQSVLDTSGHKHAGSVKGKAVRTIGRFSAAISFDGETHIDLGNIADFERSDDFSYGAWIRPIDDYSMAVLARMDDSSAYRGYDLLLAHQGGSYVNGPQKVYVHLVHEWPNNAIRVNTKQPIELNRWHHVTVTYDGSSKADGVTIYVNGKLQPVEVTHDNLTGSIKTPKPLHIGRRNSSGPFKGIIDDVRIYDRMLTAAEVDELTKSIRTVASRLRVHAHPADTVVRLVWSPPEGRGVKGYRVYRAGAAQPIHRQHLLLGPEFIDIGLTNGRIYGYIITAVLTDGTEWERYQRVAVAPGVQIDLNGKWTYRSFGKARIEHNGEDVRILATWEANRALGPHYEVQASLSGLILRGIWRLVVKDAPNSQKRGAFYAEVSPNGNTIRVSKTEDTGYPKHEWNLAVFSRRDGSDD